ncbi:glycosyltransferase family 4 protein [Nocardioides sp. CN2-186]|uniref:glycosyltransferase family 4 protein n=1 Tax=Nocardioides tweenelious TaxID=3156607 RepID=UPI0032B5829F
MPRTDAALLVGRHVAFFSWRDTRNPEGGGAERYLEKVATGLVERGCTVTIFCAAYAGGAPDEVVDGVHYVRRGTKLSVYVLGMWALLRRQLGRVDVVVDVQNGLPFFTPLVTRKPVVVLVHHVHREQWPVVYPGVTGRVGWWIESSFAPRLYRRRQYVAVSRATRAELRELGVTGPRVAVVHNGTDPVVSVDARKSAYPSICVVGRLVPHKQVEHAIDAARELVEEFPDLRLRIVGGGWWEAELHDYARDLVERGVVVFEGHVTEVRKQEIYEESWLMALPSVKEGWGLVVGEAAAHGTPTIAYASAGGTRESIVDGVSGVLVDSPGELTAALGALLRNREERERLALGATTHSEGFTWAHSQSAFAHVVASALRGDLVTDQDATED